MDERMRMPDTLLQTKKKAEAAEILAKIAEYPEREQEHALAFLRGIQFAQGIQPQTVRPGS